MMTARMLAVAVAVVQEEVAGRLGLRRRLRERRAWTVFAWFGLASCGERGAIGSVSGSLGRFLRSRRPWLFDELFWEFVRRKTWFGGWGVSGTQEKRIY